MQASQNSGRAQTMYGIMVAYLFDPALLFVLLGTYAATLLRLPTVRLTAFIHSFLEASSGFLGLSRHASMPCSLTFRSVPRAMTLSCPCDRRKRLMSSDAPWRSGLIT